MSLKNVVYIFQGLKNITAPVHQDLVSRVLENAQMWLVWRASAPASRGLISIIVETNSQQASKASWLGKLRRDEDFKGEIGTGYTKEREFPFSLVS